MSEETTVASKILAMLGEARCSDLAEIDRQVESLKNQMASLQKVRGIIATALGQVAPAPSRSSKQRVSHLDPERRKLARILIAKGSGMARIELCQIVGYKPGENKIETLLRHSWFVKGPDDLWRITAEGRSANEA